MDRPEKKEDIIKTVKRMMAVINLGPSQAILKGLKYILTQMKMDLVV